MNRIYIIISGSRKLNKSFRPKLICKFLKNLLNIVGHNLTVIHGDCEYGIDALIDHYCKELSIDRIKYPANWGKYGRKAGWVRNNLMFAHGNPDYVICIYNSLQRKSPGTKMTEKLSNNYRIPAIITSVVDLMNNVKGVLENSGLKEVIESR